MSPTPGADAQPAAAQPAAAAGAAIAVAGLAKTYGEAEKTVHAVAGIDFSVAPGSVTALLGGNGAGKTTTIAMLLGLLKPTAGSIRILDTDMLRDRHRILPRLNFSSPYVDLPHRLTVRQNLMVFAGLYAVPQAAKRIAQLAEELNFAALLNRPAGALSAGQKTRVALAKALINQPDVLLLDEPTASLDPDTADWVRSLLEKYRAERGVTILLASHNMGEVERLCDQVLMMKQGRIVDRGTAPALVAKYGRQNLEQVFLDIARGQGKAAELDAVQA
jgi:ABC-2 type transport system ATP-binding protein